MLACDPRDTVTTLGPERRDMGYSPHTLSPGVEGDPRDAGKCYLDSPRHRTPDIYRSFAPGTTAEVKRRARQRIADGLPTLTDRDQDDAIDVAEVPPLLMAIERVFAEAGFPEWMATQDLLAALRDDHPDLTEMQLAAGVPVDRDESGSRKRRAGDRHAVRGYLLSSIQRAMESL
jgi:hypothetical protein